MSELQTQLKDFKELEQKWYKGDWPSQIVIDCFEDIGEDLNELENLNNQEQRDSIGSQLNYLDNLLVIYNPALTNDIEIINNLISILKKIEVHFEAERIIEKF